MNINHAWGIHDMSVHRDHKYFEWLEKLQPRSIKLFEWSWSNEGYCNDLKAVLPDDCVYLLRDHPLSEQKQSVIDDPAGTGIRFANEWITKWNEGHVFTPRDRSIHLGVNELDTNQNLDELAITEENRAIHLRRAGLRAGLLSMAVGQPVTIDHSPKTKRDWQKLNNVRDLLRAEDFHKAVIHEYGAKENYGWGYWVGAFALGCPWDLFPGQVIYGEFGIDQHVADGKGNRGWRSLGMTAEQYMSWLQQAHRIITSDPRTHSIQIFTYDFFNPWGSFTIHEPHIRELLLATYWQMGNERELFELVTDTPVRVNYINGHAIAGSQAAQEGIPITIYVPSIQIGKEEETNVYIPQVVDENGYRKRDDVSQEERDKYNWAMFNDAMADIFEIEGGYVDNPFDKGGPTNFGISSNANPDINVSALTPDTASVLYWDRYWKPSGAWKYDTYPKAYTVMDSAVQHGVTTTLWMWKRAKEVIKEMTAIRIELYTSIDDIQWDEFSKGWMNRMAKLIRKVF